MFYYFYFYFFNLQLVEQLGNQIVHQPICFNVINFFQIDLKFFHLVSSDQFAVCYSTFKVQ